jgi:hypothetical protein
LNHRRGVDDEDLRKTAAVTVGKMERSEKKIEERLGSTRRTPERSWKGRRGQRSMGTARTYARAR